MIIRSATLIVLFVDLSRDYITLYRAWLLSSVLLLLSVLLWTSGMLPPPPVAMPGSIAASPSYTLPC